MTERLRCARNQVVRKFPDNLTDGRTVSHDGGSGRGVAGQG